MNKTITQPILPRRLTIMRRFFHWADEHETGICLVIIGIIALYFAGAVILAKISGTI